MYLRTCMQWFVALFCLIGVFLRVRAISPNYYFPGDPDLHAPPPQNNQSKWLKNQMARLLEERHLGVLLSAMSLLLVLAAKAPGDYGTLHSHPSLFLQFFCMCDDDVCWPIDRDKHRPPITNHSHTTQRSASPTSWPSSRGSC